MQHKHLILALITLLFIHGSTPAQHIDYHPLRTDTAYVISTTGLSLRKGPGSQHSRIAVAPIGAMVQVFKDVEPVPDSLSPVKCRYGPGKDDRYLVHRHGHWVKVQYDGQSGYMFDIFLGYGPDERRMKEFEGMNARYRILRPGGDCNNNYVYEPGWTWYGLYMKDSVHQELRKIELSQFRLGEEMGGDYYLTDDMNGLVSMIGLKGVSLPEGKVNGFTRGTYQGVFFYPGEDKEARIQKLRTLGLEAGIPEKYDDYYQPGKMSLSVVQGAKSQQLYPREGLTPPTELVFAGDLDGDGRRDYIIYYGEKWGQTVLYLSSKRKGSQLVAPVALYFSSYCC